MITKGALAGIRVVEFAGMGPGPFAAMMLADMGADVIRIDRAQAKKGGRTVNLEGEPEARSWLMHRGRRSIAVDLKNPEGVELARRLIGQADALIEGFRPGVMERLGLGPTVLFPDNPRLVYGRATGWGQDGPLAQTVGHDINYIALSGALHSIGPAGGPPVVPLNLVGDFGGGGMYLAFGMVCALLSARANGAGQEVDAAMLDGSALLMTSALTALQQGRWRAERGTNILDGCAPWYTTYECSDGQWVAVGALEPDFYLAFLRGLGLDSDEVPDRDDRANWPALRAQFSALISARTRDEWAAVFGSLDACVSPVLALDEVGKHSHSLERGIFAEYEGLLHPAPGPRLSLTPASIGRPPPLPGEHGIEILRDWGFDPSEFDRLRLLGAIA